MLGTFHLRLPLVYMFPPCPLTQWKGSAWVGKVTSVWPELVGDCCDISLVTMVEVTARELLLASRWPTGLALASRMRCTARRAELLEETLASLLRFLALCTGALVMVGLLKYFLRQALLLKTSALRCAKLLFFPALGSEPTGALGVVSFFCRGGLACLHLLALTLWVGGTCGLDRLVPEAKRNRL